MVSAKERDERGRSIRANILKYMKTGQLTWLNKAMAELKILVDLAELAPAKQPLGDHLLLGVITGLTDTEVDEFVAAVRGEEPREESHGFLESGEQF